MSDIGGPGTPYLFILEVEADLSSLTGNHHLFYIYNVDTSIRYYYI